MQTSFMMGGGKWFIHTLFTAWLIARYGLPWILWIAIAG